MSTPRAVENVTLYFGMHELFTTGMSCVEARELTKNYAWAATFTHENQDGCKHDMVYC